MRGTDTRGWALTVPSATSTGTLTRLGGRLLEAPAIAAGPATTTPVVIGTGTDGNLWATERRGDRTWTLDPLGPPDLARPHRRQARPSRGGPVGVRDPGTTQGPLHRSGPCRGGRSRTRTCDLTRVKRAL